MVKAFDRGCQAPPPWRTYSLYLKGAAPAITLGGFRMKPVMVISPPKGDSLAEKPATTPPPVARPVVWSMSHTAMSPMVWREGVWSFGLHTGPGLIRMVVSLRLPQVGTKFGLPGGGSCSQARMARTLAVFGPWPHGWRRQLRSMGSTTAYFRACGGMDWMSCTVTEAVPA